MRVAILNPMFGVDFTKSARWFARSRGRVQRHPDYLAYMAGTVEAAGHDILWSEREEFDELLAHLGLRPLPQLQVEDGES